MGTLSYMSPELLSGNEPYNAKAADIFALGVSLFTLLNGNLPFPKADCNGLGSTYRLIYKKEY